MDFKHFLGKLPLVILGNIINALSVTLFLVPSGLITGGVTGIALAMNHYLGIRISIFVFLFNAAMLVVGLFVLGKEFVLSTIVSTFTYPLALGVFEKVFAGVVLTEDILLNTLFAGMGIGLALGIVIRCGSSTGGMDIPPLVCNKIFGIPVSVSMYIFDFAILILQMMYNPIDMILYGIILVIVYTVMLDKLLLIGQSRIEVKVVSKKAEEIRRMILSRIDRGVTMLAGETGYMHDQTQIVMSVISKRELPLLKAQIQKIDPESFMVVSQVSEVRGHGFTMSKEYR